MAKLCPDVLEEDEFFIAVCEKKEGHKGKHKATRILTKNEETTIEWSRREFGIANTKSKGS